MGMDEEGDVKNTESQKKAAGARWNKVRCVAPSIGALASLSIKSRTKFRAVAGMRGKVSEKKIIRKRTKKDGDVSSEEEKDSTKEEHKSSSLSLNSIVKKMSIVDRVRIHLLNLTDGHEEEEKKDPLESSSEEEFEDEYSDPSQRHYLKACAVEGVIPAKVFLNGLPFDELKMRHHCLGAQGTKACAIALVNNVAVEFLDLSHNDMGPEGAQYMSDLFTENFNFRGISLGFNGLGSTGTKIIMDTLKLNTNIRKLDLSGNGLSDMDARNIAELFDVNYTMKELFLSHNEFGEEAGIIFGEIIGAIHNTLEKVDFSWNNMRRKGAAAICNGLRENTTIKQMHLAMNGWHTEGCKAMGEALMYNTTLEYLDLSHNRIGEGGLTELMKGVKVNDGLTTLLLEHNPISIKGAKEMLTILTEMPNDTLTDVDIWDQSIDKEFITKHEEMKLAKPKLKIKHGIFLKEEVKLPKIEDFDSEDPMFILLECMSKMNIRLVDLFQELDEDGSQSLSYEEFQDGLKAINIPMSDEDIGRLLCQLDKDGDGEVDFGELMSAQKVYKKKLSIMKMLGGKVNIKERPPTKFGKAVHDIQQTVKQTGDQDEVQETGDQNTVQETGDTSDQSVNGVQFTDESGTLNIEEQSDGKTSSNATTGDPLFRTQPKPVIK